MKERDSREECSKNHQLFGWIERRAVEEFPLQCSMKPQLHLTSRTATGFDVFSDARSPIELDTYDLRRKVKVNLSILDGPKVRVVNHVDSASPPVEFAFINENVLWPGVEKALEHFVTGCQCKRNNECDIDEASICHNLR